MTVLPAMLYVDATRTSTPLVGAQCRAQKQHLVVYAGLGLCCIHDYSRDKKQPPRSFTQPLEIVAQQGVSA